MPAPLSSLTKLIDELAVALQKKRQAEQAAYELAQRIIQDSGHGNVAVEAGPEPEAGSEAAVAAATRAVDLKMALQQLSYTQQEAMETISGALDAIDLVRRSLSMSITEWSSTVEAVGTDYRDRIAAEQELYATAKQERRRLAGKLRARYQLLQQAEQSI